MHLKMSGNMDTMDSQLMSVISVDNILPARVFFMFHHYYIIVSYHFLTNTCSAVPRRKQVNTTDKQEIIISVCRRMKLT